MISSEIDEKGFSYVVSLYAYLKQQLRAVLTTPGENINLPLFTFHLSIYRDGVGNNVLQYLQ